MQYKDLFLKEISELLKNPPPNVRIRVYYDSEEKRVKVVRTKIKNKYTLNQLGSKIDQISDAIINLTKTVDRIDTRLDYVIQANNLKDLPKTNKKSF